MKYIRVMCGETLEVGDVIQYKCEIGNLGLFTSTITGIVLEDENVLKLDDHGFVRYHHAYIKKVKVQINGRHPTSNEWRKTAEFHLKSGLADDFYRSTLRIKFGPFRTHILLRYVRVRTNTVTTN